MGNGKSTAAKADTAVKLVIIFFVSLLSFSIGTYVGKQVSDSESRQAKIESDYNGGEAVVENSEEVKEDAATQPISDEDVSSLTEEFVKKERSVANEASAELEGTVKTEEPTAATVTTEDKTHDGYTVRAKAKAADAEEYTINAHSVPSEAPATKAADRVAHNLAPAADPKLNPTAKVLPSVATTAVGKYTVQVASYATEGEAKAQAAKLTEKGYSAFFIPATVNGKTWYRVSVGLFADPKTAANYRTELISTQTVSTAIVQKIVK